MKRRHVGLHGSEAINSTIFEDDRMNGPTTKALGVCATVWIIVFIVVIVRRPVAGADADPAEDPFGDTAWRAVQDDGKILGVEGATIRLVAVVDYTTHASRSLDDLLRTLLATHSDSMAIGIRVAPFHSNVQSYPAAIAAVCAASQHRFTAYHQSLMDNQPRFWGAHIDSLAAAAGLDLAAFRACRRSRAAAKIVAADIAWLRRTGIPSIPSVVAGATVSAGPFDPAKLEQLADLAYEHRKKAGDALAGANETMP